LDLKIIAVAKFIANPDVILLVLQRTAVIIMYKISCHRTITIY